MQHNATLQLINTVGAARNEYIALIQNISEQQAAVKSAENEWNIIDNTEHLYWAEQGAIFGMWKILFAIRNGKAERTYASPHKDWSVEKLLNIPGKKKRWYRPWQRRD